MCSYFLPRYFSHYRKNGHYCQDGEPGDDSKDEAPREDAEPEEASGWVWGFLAAIFGGVIVTGAILNANDVVGVAVSLAAPFMVGGLIGYLCSPGNEARSLGRAVLGGAALTAIIVVLMTLDLSGLFCGVVSGVLLFGPVCIGILIGACLRDRRRDETSRSRRTLPVLFFLALPPTVALAESLWPATPPRVARHTWAHVDASPERVWEALRFYDELRHDPPPVFELGFPRPIRTHGDFEHVGDRQTCVYDKGTVEKVLTRRIPRRELGFRVLDQQLGFERSVQLRQGGFRLEEVAGGTRITLTTEYDAPLRPRFLWAPVEWWVVRSLQEYIIEGIEIELDEARREFDALADRGAH